VEVVRFRVIVAVLILMLNFLFAPFLLIFPFYAKNYGFKEGLPKWETYIKEKPLSGISLLLKRENIKIPWLWLQPAVFAALVSVFMPMYGKRKGKTNKLGHPETAGRGEYGTARWRTEKEVSKTFTVWNLNSNTPPEKRGLCCRI
jgi:type IV secretion system protein VirD4